MGLHLGAIFVAVKDGVTQGSVADFVCEYWLNIGAQLSDQNPLEIKPLSLAKTGCLAYAVCPETKDKSGQAWVGLFDSERYSADPALARALAVHFDTDAWFYEVTDSVNSAYAKKYGKKEEEIRSYSKAMNRVEAFPMGFYFNQLKDVPKDELEKFRFLAFDSVPHRPKARYSGPSPQRLVTNDLIGKARLLVEQRDASGLLALADDSDVYREVIRSAIENADPADPKDRDFITKLTPLAFRNKSSFCSVAEAALRRKDEKLFEQALEKIPQYALFKLEQRARELGKGGEHLLAFRLLEALTRTAECKPRTLNSTAFYLCQITEPGILPGSRMDEFLEKAQKAGPADSFIFHNLACIYVRRKEFEKALRCVSDAVKYGYPHMDKLKNDADLDPIKRDPRFKAALETRPVTGSLEHFHVSRSTRLKKIPWVAPTVGLHLYFKGNSAQPGAAALIERLADEFPKMFSFHLPSNRIHLAAVKKGRLTRDIKRLRKGEAGFYDKVYYNALEDGAACDQRFYLDLRDDKSGAREGEISVHLPADLAQDPKKLRERFVEYSSMLPVEVGNAGYSLAVYYASNGCPAIADLFDLLNSHLGLTTSQGATHHLPNAQVVVPNWLTFLGRRVADKAKQNLKELGDLKVVQPLSGGVVVLQAAARPFIGLVTAPDDLESLPKIVQALKTFLPEKDSRNDLLELEVGRLEQIGKL